MYYRDEIHFNTFMTAMRKGKNVTLEQLGWGLCSISMINRIERGERLPDKLMRDRLMDRLGVVNDGFEDFLFPDEYALWKERQNLLRAIEDKDIKTAEEKIYLYEKNSSGDNSIEYQFYLAMKIQLMQYQGRSDEELRAVIKQAIELTIPDCSVDTWNDYLLAVQEWNLLLEYIRCGGDVGVARESGTNAADKVTAYEKLLAAIQQSAMDIYSCVKIYPKAVYYLCLEWMKPPVQDWDCQRMLTLAENALEMLCSTGRMYYLCELLEIMERIFSVWNGCSDRAADENVHIQITLPQVQEWRRVLSEIFLDKGISEKMESCAYLYWQMYNYSIGDVVRKRRKMLGMTAKKLCDGICSEKTLRRLENNRASTHMQIVGELFERMGLSPEYQRKKIVTDRYEAIALYDTATKALNNQDMDTLNRVLPQLRETLPMDIVINRQEMEFLDTLRLWHCGQITEQDCACRLQQVLEYTVPMECVKSAEDGYLSCGEMLCAYNIAMRSDGTEKDTYMNLLRRICEWSIEENDTKMYIILYELLMYRVASHLGDIGEYQASNEITEDIIEKDLLLRRMNMLHLCIYNRLWNQMKIAAESNSANQKSPIKEDLRKCIQLAKLCKETLYEKFYSEKLNGLSDEKA
ncbi:MAG: transcriptional regulator [Acetatifactor sp.]|nr:transcriptional regulator [Acetatifactor sp.]